MKETLLLADDLVVDLMRRQVFRQGVAIKLSDLSFRTLLALFENAPNVVSIEQLIEQVWQGVAVSPETVTQRIAMLRKSLSGNTSQHDRYIVSVRNQGYRLVPLVKAKKVINWRNNHLLFVGLLLVVGGACIGWFVMNSKEKQQPIKLNATTQSEDFNQKGWRYLKKHDARSNRLAREMFEQSLQQRADSLDGLVGLSVVLSHEVSKFNQSNVLLKQAITLANKATQLYPGEAKAWTALGFAHDVMGDLDTAISHYNKALELNPQRSTTLGAVAYLHGIKGELLQSLKLNLQVLNSDQEYTNLQVAQNLHLLGFVELADQWYQRADVLSPDSVFASSERVRFLMSNQRYQEAQSLLDQAIARGIDRPENHTLQGILQLIRGEKILALSSFEQALTINDEDFEAKVWALTLSDKVENKTAMLEQLWLDKAYYWPVDVINKVIFYAAMGDRNKVLAGLEDAFNQGYMDSQWLLQLPPIKPYLSDHEFLFWIDQIQQKADSQRQQLLTVDWLPVGFLDPAPPMQ